MADIPSNASGAVAETLAEKTGATSIPLFEEEFRVSKRVVPTSRVQVSRVTHSHEQLVNELLNHEHVEVERISVNKPVDEMPSIRDDEDTIVIPVVEEVVKVERYLLLKEEVHIRRVRTTERYQESVTLRKHEAVVTRLPIEHLSAATADAATTDGTTDK